MSGSGMDPQLKTKQNALMRNLVKAKKASTPPQPMYTETLASHNTVNGAFTVALLKEDYLWNIVPKLKDQFLNLKDTPLFQHWFNNSSLWSLGKCSLMDSSKSIDRPGPTKYAHRDMGSQHGRHELISANHKFGQYLSNHGGIRLPLLATMYLS